MENNVKLPEENGIVWYKLTTLSLQLVEYILFYFYIL